MGTRSNIIVKVSNGKWQRIYCHWDGYISHHGPILLEHYNSQELAEKLVSGGDLSSLDINCEVPDGSVREAPHKFGNPVDGYCVYYGRDRGEEQTVRLFDTLFEAFPKGDSWTEYVYIWNGETWLFSPLPVPVNESLGSLQAALDHDKIRRLEGLAEYWIVGHTIPLQENLDA